MFLEYLGLKPMLLPTDVRLFTECPVWQFFFILLASSSQIELQYTNASTERDF